MRPVVGPVVVGPVAHVRRLVGVEETLELCSKTAVGAYHLRQGPHKIKNIPQMVYFY